MSIKYQLMSISDYDEVVALWSSVDGIGLHDDCDSREGIGSYLRRNPGMSFIARCEDKLVGAVICGTDGRRGYLHHLAVSPEFRGQGIGKTLVDKCLSALAAAGIPKCNIMVFADNTDGYEFWKSVGWFERPDAKFLQKFTT